MWTRTYVKTLLCYRRAKILLMFFKLYNINRSQSFLATYMWGKQQQKDPLYRPTFSINLTHNAENTFRSLASSYLNGQCKFGGQPWQQCPSSATLNDHGERSSRNSHLTHGWRQRGRNIALTLNTEKMQTMRILESI